MPNRSSVKLPALSLDLRKEALENVDGINVITDNNEVIANVKIWNGSYDHAGEIVDRVNGVPKALEVASDYGQCDGAHHKMWVIDQMVRALTGRRLPKLCRQIQRRRRLPLG